MTREVKGQYWFTNYDKRYCTFCKQRKPRLGSRIIIGTWMCRQCVEIHRNAK